MESFLETANNQRFMRLLNMALFVGDGGVASEYRRRERAPVKYFRHYE